MYKVQTHILHKNEYTKLIKVCSLVHTVVVVVVVVVGGGGGGGGVVAVAVVVVVVVVVVALCWIMRTPGYR